SCRHGLEPARVLCRREALLYASLSYRLDRSASGSASWRQGRGEAEAPGSPAVDVASPDAARSRQRPYRMTRHLAWHARTAPSCSLLALSPSECKSAMGCE